MYLVVLGITNQYLVIYWSRGTEIEPKGTKRNQKEPNGTEMEPKGTEMEPKGTKRNQKWEPLCDREAPISYHLTWVLVSDPGFF